MANDNRGLAAGPPPVGMRIHDSFEVQWRANVKARLRRGCGAGLLATLTPRQVIMIG